MRSELENIVLEAYDAALDPTTWPRVLDRVVELADARGAFIFDIDTSEHYPSVRATYHTSNYDPQLVSDYLKLHHEQEFEDQAKFAAFSLVGDRINLVPDTVLAPSREELTRRANARAMMGYGIHHRAGALLNKDHFFTDRFAIQFSERAGPAEGERLETILSTLPHIAKALNIGRHATRHFESNHAAFGVLDLLRIGVCILSADGQVVFKNREFDRQMEGHGAFFIAPKGHLTARDEAVRQDLARLFGGHANHGKYGARPRKEAIFHPIGDEGLGLCIEVTPLHAPDFMGEKAFNGFAMFSLDSSQPHAIETGFLAKTFSLTPSEEAVLTMVAEGLTNAQISERRNRSPETVNTQIKTLLAKTMSQNRTQLIRLATEFSPKLFVESPITHSGDEGKAAAG